MEWDCLKGLGIDRKETKGRKKNTYRLKWRKLKKEKKFVYNFNSYFDYLRSARWKRIKKEWKSNNGFKFCYCCHKKPTEVHHITYKNRGNEEGSDMVAVCRGCHARITDMVFCRESKLKEAHIVLKKLLELEI